MAGLSTGSSTIVGSAQITNDSIINDDINSAAAIAVSKLAALGTAKVVQTNATTGILEASAVTNTSLSYLDATSSVQTQINTKAPTASPTFTGTVGGITKAMVGLTNVDDTSDATKNAATVTLTNKSLSDSTTSIVDVTDATKKILFDAGGTTVTTTTITAAQTASRVVTLPDATDTLVGKATTDILTNKTIDADGVGNSITNIENADIKAAAAIALTKLAATTVSRALVSDASGFVSPATTTSIEIGYVNGVTSAIQTQLGAGVTALANHEADTTAIHGIADTSLLVTTTGTQALTNKDIDGGVASNTRRLTVPSATKATLDALTRKEGTIVYATDTDKFYSDNGTVLTAVGSGSGTKNYITGGDAETGTTGFATYADAAATRPVDGTAGAANVTWTTSATAPLADSNSFIFTKDAVNRQGQGVGYAFTIDAANQAKVLQISFDYLVASGTFVAGTSTTDSDIIAYIYDVTNAVLIEPSSFKLLSNSTTIADKFSATFQTASNSTSYRLILHVASVSALAYTLKFDSITVSPSVYPTGTPISDWQSYTPTGTFTTNTTYTGKWRRVGNMMEASVKMAFAGAPNSVNSSINLPSGYSMDTGILLSTAGDGHVFGVGQYLRSGSAAYYLRLDYSSTTAMRVVTDSAASAAVYQASALVTQAIPATIALNDTIILNYSVPILGWGASTQMSSETDTRVVAARYTASTAASMGTLATAWSDVVFNTKESDTHNGMSGASYTVQVSGFYNISGQINTSGASTAGGTVQTKLVKDGVSITYSGHNQSSTATGYTVGFNYRVIELRAGNVIKLQAASNLTTPAYGTDAVGNYIQIERISGPSAIAASESVNARYYASATSISGTLATIVFTTKDFDSHGAYASGLFTCGISGKYQINAGLGLTGTFALNTTNILEIQKNSTAASNVTKYSGGIVTNETIQISDVISCLAGDVLRIQASSAATTPAIVSSNSKNFLSITRVGN